MAENTEWCAGKGPSLFKMSMIISEIYLKFHNVKDIFFEIQKLKYLDIYGNDMIWNLVNINLKFSLVCWSWEG